MYRAFALKALRRGVPLDSSRELQALSQDTSIRLEPGSEENRVVLDGEDVTGQLRNPIVTDAASRVSAIPAVRAWMVRLQQELAADGGVVMEGRDIGTVIFPHAEAKIFLDAAPEVPDCAGLTSLAPRPSNGRRKSSATSASATIATATVPILRSVPHPMPSSSTPLI